ncbi:MAG: hypothetical protein KY456_04190, partial [Chloroflexi bacterium]|nr:hypothetical protein [Chloroflexota bacterium]
LRWVGQHQGGYPVEFYPLGEAWLEVAVRVLSLGTLSAESAHTLTVVALFLLPGVGFVALAHEDGWSAAVGLIAVALHVSLPGGWYDGGYTELVQWGLVTNVAAAVASILMLPALIRFLRAGTRWAAVAAALLAAFAVYANPRSLLGLAALGLGAWLAGILRRDGAPLIVLTLRLALVAGVTALLAAPELVALARFRDLYTFVTYSGYNGLAEYGATAARGVTWPVLGLGLLGLALGLVIRRRRATTTVAVALLVYLMLTATLIVVPAAAGLAPQLEPTRLMPLQRLLTIYLAAVASWTILSWLTARIVPSRRQVAPLAAGAVSVAILLTQTRPLDGPPPDPASPAIPPVSLYSVAMSGQPEQADLEAAVRAADEAASPGTALLVLGSALSWHQQLWAPLWTTRPLFYDNWLWYWHPDHAGTPGYLFLTGHHYPDPERTLDRDYLGRHGIGGVIVTGPVRMEATRSPLLRPLRFGVYDAYTVIDPVTTVTFGDHTAASIVLEDHQVTATSTAPGDPITARINWHPRWQATVAEVPETVTRLNNGYLGIESSEPAMRAELVYSLQPLGWFARVLAAVGVAGIAWIILGHPPKRFQDGRWYSRQVSRDDRFELTRDRSRW